LTFTKANFFNEVFPYASRASQKTNIPVSVIMGQWAVESTYGTSDVAVKDLNLGGIKKVSSSIALPAASPSGYAMYKDYNQFVDDYIRVMNLPLYNAVRNAVSVNDTVNALGGSKYAEGTYEKGKTILSVISSNNLTKYDNMVAPSQTTPTLNYNDILNKVNNASAEDLKKWAIVGAGVVTLLALIK
jgi:flagellum-specific peptidoglycan hydrolase FlgJ